MKIVNNNIKSKLSVLGVACALAASLARAQSESGLYRPLTLAPADAAASGGGGAGDNDEKTIGPLKLLDDGWHFTLAVPALLPSFSGEVGVNGHNSHIDVPADKVIQNLDMAAFFRGEVSNGRFGIMADFITMSLSTRIEPDGLVKTLGVHFDEIIGEPALRWRLLEGARGWLDVYAGVRYVNIYQSADVQPNAQRIEATSTALVNAVGDRLRTALSESGLRDLIAQDVGGQLTALGGATTLPAAPIAGSLPGVIRDQIQAIIDARKAELAEAIRQGAQQRINAIKSDLSQSIARTIESGLDKSVSRVDDWWDPIIGMRGRFNLSRAWYLTGRTDIGGFSVGSQLAWQVEAALGYQITRNFFVEAGYRALSMNYQGNGFTYDVIAQGAEVTIGVSF